MREAYVLRYALACAGHAMTIYCPVCNRSSDVTRFIGEFCEPCVIKRLEAELPKKVTLVRCPTCGRIKARNAFVSPTSVSIALAVKSSLRLPEYTLYARGALADPLSLEFMTEAEGEHVSFGRALELKIDRQMCADCQRRRSGYYEAVFKVHGDDVRVAKIAERFSHFIESNNGFISKTVRTGNGVEIYSSDKKAANEFFVQNRIKVKRSYSLYGMKRGRKLYRNIYSLIL